MATGITDRQRQLEQVGHDLQQVWASRLGRLSGFVDMPQGLSAQDLPAYRALLSDLGSLKMSWELALAEMVQVLEPGLPWHWCEMGTGEAEAHPAVEMDEPKVLRQAPNLLPSTNLNTPALPSSLTTMPPVSSSVPESASISRTEDSPSISTEKQRQISFKRLSDFAAFVKEEPQQLEEQSRPSLQSPRVQHQLILPETGPQLEHGSQTLEGLHLPSSPSSFVFPPETLQDKAQVNQEGFLPSAQEKTSLGMDLNMGVETAFRGLPLPEQGSGIQTSVLPPYPIGAIGLPTWEGVQTALESLTASPRIESLRHKGRSQVAMRNKAGNGITPAFPPSAPLTKGKAKSGLPPSVSQSHAAGFEASDLGQHTNSRHTAPSLPSQEVSQPRSPFLEGLNMETQLRQAESLKGLEITPKVSFSQQEPFMVDQLMDALTDQLKRDFKRLYGA